MQEENCTLWNPIFKSSVHCGDEVSPNTGMLKVNFGGADGWREGTRAHDKVLERSGYDGCVVGLLAPFLAV